MKSFIVIILVVKELNFVIQEKWCGVGGGGGGGAGGG